MKAKALPSGFAVLMIVLAGCVGTGQSTGTGNDPPLPPAEEPRFSDETGSIVGLVTNDESTPLPGATVGIQALAMSTTTDAGGRFTLNNVPPGDHGVVALMLGYESQGRKVSVVVGVVSEITFMLLPIAVEEPFPKTRTEIGNIQCSVRFYPGVPTGGTGGLPTWVTGVAVCGLASLPGFAPDRFLINYDWDKQAREVLLEMEWKSTQASGRGLSVVLEHQGHPNDLKYTFGSTLGISPLTVYANETKMAEVAESSGIDCLDVACKVYTRVFAAANTTELYVPFPALGPLGQPPQKLDVGLVIDQRFTQYMTSFYGMTRPADFTRLADR